MKKMLLTVFIISCVVANISLAQELKVEGKKLQEGQSLYLFRSDLTGGRIEIVLSEPLAKSVDISFDRGRNWQSMEKDTGGAFVYKYHPHQDEAIEPVFLVSQKDKTYTYNPHITINYSKQKPEEAVISLIEKMKAYYEAERKSRFLNLFSRRFPDFIKFQESIQNDFYNYNNIRLDYTIYQETFSPDYTAGIWTVKWEKKYTDKNGNQMSDEATIAMRFSKERGRWLVSGMRNNTIFGSSLLATDLSISSSDITKAASYTVAATVHNAGSYAVSNVQVKFYEDSGGSYALHCTKTISNISANNTASVTCDFSALGPGPVNIKVVVDEPNTISESNETNNQAIKNINLG